MHKKNKGRTITRKNSSGFSTPINETTGIMIRTKLIIIFDLNTGNSVAEFKCTIPPTICICDLRIFHPGAIVIDEVGSPMSRESVFGSLDGHGGLRLTSKEYHHHNRESTPGTISRSYVTDRDKSDPWAVRSGRIRTQRKTSGGPQ
jgi:hypothetical protein